MQPPTTHLSGLPEARLARVASLLGSGLLRERLVELGFVQGVEVEVLRRAPFGGPLQVRVRGGTIALRRDEAACVAVVTAPVPEPARRASPEIAAGAAA